jgi:hypothetical protein
LLHGGQGGPRNHELLQAQPASPDAQEGAVSPQ